MPFADRGRFFLDGEERMKKILNFLRSMKFGVILLGLIVLISAAGSLIPQNESPMTYVRAYPDYYQMIFFLQLDHVFTSWYFIALTVLLCLNLTFCSLTRFGRLREKDPARERAFQVKAAVKADPEEMKYIKEYLGKYHQETRGDMTVYYGNDIGRYGTFLTHLGILLTVVFWAAAMYLPAVTDLTCMPQETAAMEDGTRIFVDSFSIEDETGRLDYSSMLKIILPDGRDSELKRCSVNHPVSFGRYKVYQQTYGTAGKVSVRDAEGHEDVFYPEAKDFLSADGKNGIWYDDLYPGFLQDEEGHLTLITSTSGHYENPVYVFDLVTEGQPERMLAFPGDSVETGGYVFTFEEPAEYPGLRVKKSPGWVNPLLLAGFLIMTAGLWITFFLPPVLVSTEPEGYTVLGPKPETMRMRLKEEIRRRKQSGGTDNA